MNKDDPCIKELIPIQGCPPKREQIADALAKAGIKINPELFTGETVERGIGMLMQKYKGNPEFDESFYQIK